MTRNNEDLLKEIYNLQRERVMIEKKCRLAVNIDLKTKPLALEVLRIMEGSKWNSN